MNPILQKVSSFGDEEIITMIKNTPESDAGKILRLSTDKPEDRYDYSAEGERYIV